MFGDGTASLWISPEAFRAICVILDVMSPEIHDFLRTQQFVTRQQILSLGHDDYTIQDLVRRRELIRIGPGLFAGREYLALSTVEQHVVRCHAVATRFEGRVAFSHQSAAALHGLPTWGLSLEHVHVTRIDGGRSRRHAGVAHHARQLVGDHLVTVDGLTVVSPERAVWDIATLASIESALVTADAALHLGLVDVANLEVIAAAFGDWRGARRAKVVLSLADGRSESPGETRVRYALYRAGLPKPELQYRVYDDHGVLIGVVDFAWPELRHIAEFDGMMKYEMSVTLAKEKAREDALRRQGWGITRIVWSQLRPGLRRTLMDEIREALESSWRQFGHLAA